ncbi:Uncharacterized protein dnm_035430 [Desulfonema magnum]|uniref:Uncharacterized protein n=1 Tax=Desulfonema magnum TaxID=45655 RepID=A0A975GN86_9BACT|nr:Uncharacterized protein dnm_035430 [Desulfonema magnum]
MQKFYFCTCENKIFALRKKLSTCENKIFALRKKTQHLRK